MPALNNKTVVLTDSDVLEGLKQKEYEKSEKEAIQKAKRLERELKRQQEEKLVKEPKKREKEQQKKEKEQQWQLRRSQREIGGKSKVAQAPTDETIISKFETLAIRSSDDESGE